MARINVSAKGNVSIGGPGSDGNTVANTVTGAGISLADAEGVQVLGNRVRSNASQGIKVRRSADIVIGSDGSRNTIVGNGGHGIVLGANSVSGPTRVSVVGNHVGGIDSADGNGGDGIRLEWTTGDAAFSNILIEGNEVRSNADVGIRLTGLGLDDVEMHRNLLSANGLCPVVLEGGANSESGAKIAPSGIVVATNEEGATGTWAGSGLLQSVEIFSDSGDELAYFHGLGAAGVAANTWKFALTTLGADAVEELRQGRVSVMVTVLDGAITRTSAVENLCGDGCGGGSCNDRNPCTTDGVCAADVCAAPVNVANGTACQSGDPCRTDQCQTGECTSGALTPFCNQCGGETVTGADLLPPACADGTTDNECTGDRCDPVTGSCTHAANVYVCEADGNPCTADDTCDATLGCTYDPRPATFICDDGDLCNTDYGLCDGAGACDAASNTTGAPFLPYATACSDARCVDGNPVYLPICGDGYCGPDDFGWCRGCIDPTNLPDIDPKDDDDYDNDGFPDVWERNGLDADCDGAVDFDNSFFGGPTGEFIPHVFVYSDWMDPAGGVSYQPDPNALTDVFDAFDVAGFVLQSDVAPSAAAYHEVLGFGGTPALEVSDDWVPFAVVKNGSAALGVNAGFDPLNRALYHYTIWGDQFSEWNTNRSGFSELGGNDFIMAPWVSAMTGTQAQQAGTFMHELGHNFALNHSGPTAEPNYEPIYPSTMNYRWQMGLTAAGGGVSGVPDYSNIELDNINEGTNLVETSSYSSATEPLTTVLYNVRWDCPSAVGGLMSALPLPDDKDWSCGAGIGIASWMADETDINGDNNLDVLTGFDDWAYLEEGGLRFSDYVTNYADGAGGEYAAGELTAEEAVERGVLLPIVEPVAALAPGCSTQSSLSGRLIPLVVYGTATFAAADIATASLRIWNGASAVASFTFDVNADGYTDWIGHFPASGVSLGAGTTTFTAKLASSQIVLAQPAVTFGTVSDGDGDKIDNNCDACPAVAGSGRFGCP